MLIRAPCLRASRTREDMLRSFTPSRVLAHTEAVFPLCAKLEVIFRLIAGKKKERESWAAGNERATLFFQFSEMIVPVANGHLAAGAQRVRLRANWS